MYILVSDAQFLQKHYEQLRGASHVLANPTFSLFFLISQQNNLLRFSCFMSNFRTSVPNSCFIAVCFENVLNLPSTRPVCASYSGYEEAHTQLSQHFHCHNSPLLLGVRVRHAWRAYLSNPKTTWGGGIQPQGQVLLRWHHCQLWVLLKKLSHI